MADSNVVRLSEHKSRDMIEMLEELLAEAREGKLDGVIVGKLIPGEHYWAAAYVDGAPYVAARLTMLALDMLHDTLDPDGVLLPDG